MATQFNTGAWRIQFSGELKVYRSFSFTHSHTKRNVAMYLQPKTLLTPILLAACAVCSRADGREVTIKVRGTSNLTFTSMVQDADGMIHITGNVISHGTGGVATGTSSYTINPATGTFAGSGKRQTPDGSTYDVHFLGQLLNATDSVGTWTTDNGTGRFAGETGKGRWAARRWANGKGSESKIEGEATKSR